MSDATRLPDLGSLLSDKVIGAGIKVHKALGPGLLENIYEECLAIELGRDKLRFERQKPLPVIYDGITLDLNYKTDLIVEDEIIIELKAVEKILSLHEAQLLTYMKLSGIALGLIMNFNSVLLKDGIRRMALSRK